MRKRMIMFAISMLFLTSITSSYTVAQIPMPIGPGGLVTVNGIPIGGVTVTIKNLNTGETKITTTSYDSPYTKCGYYTAALSGENGDVIEVKVVFGIEHVNSTIVDISKVTQYCNISIEDESDGDSFDRPLDDPSDIDLIVQTLVEKGFEVNESMVESAIGHPLRDLVVTGDGIQERILSKTEPSPASVAVGVTKSENVSLISKTSMYISVVIVADEEYISIHSDWKSRTWNAVEKIDDYFIERFGLDFVIVRFEEYYSDNSISGAHELFDDVKEKINKEDANIMIAFCGQYSGNIGGIAELRGDDVIIFYNPWNSWYKEDNIVQHELSHLFDALDHNPGYFDWCVMSYTWNSFTHGWCDNCYYRMKSYIDRKVEDTINPLNIYTDKEIYVPDENVSITLQNKGPTALSLYLKKWYIEKTTIDGTWETIYESSRFYDYDNDFAIPIDDPIAIPINDTFGIIPYKPNETVGIWVNPFVAGNLTTTLLNWDNTAETNDSIVIYDIFAEEIENYSDFQGISSHASVEDTVEIQTAGLLPITILLPNQKKTWTWPQTTSDSGEPGFGEYRVKVEYDDDYVTSSPFLITVIFTLPEEEPIIWTPSINLTYNLTTDVSIGKISISETPTFVYNPSSAIPIIETTVIGTDLNPSVVKIMTDVATGKTTIEVNSVTATTIKSLIIDNSSLLMSTSLGYREVKILPDMVKEKASLKSVKNMELKEYNNKPVYQVNGVRESKLLWFIPVDMDATAYVNAETGSVEKLEKPWWGFLAS